MAERHSGETKLLSLLLATAMMIITLALPLALPAPLAAIGTTNLTILHTNDTHAHLENIARRATKVNQIRDEVGDDNLLLVDAGDVFSGTPYFTLYQGQADLWFMNYMDYDAMTLGSHEFDKGPEVLASFVTEANFPILSANFDFSTESSLAGKIAPWAITEKGGERYGVFGLTTEETRIISNPGESIVINEHLAAARKAVADLEGEGINKIIALTHLGWDKDRELAQEVEGIDIVVGGQSHTLPDAYPALVAEDDTPTLVAQAGEYGKYLGRLEVSFNEAGIVQSWEGSQLISIDESITEEAVSAAKLAEYQEPIEELMNTVIGKTLVNLDGEQIQVRIRETNLGNLVTDAMLDKARGGGATIAIQNSGGISASIPVGDITLGQVMAVMPFGNYLVTIDLTGVQLIAALENGVSQVKEVKGRFPQVAGLRFTWVLNVEPGSRIISVEVKTPQGYQPIDFSATYRVVTNDFLHRGGDGYTVFREGANFINLGFASYEVLAEYIKDKSLLNPQVEGRILRGDPGTVVGGSEEVPFPWWLVGGIIAGLVMVVILPYFLHFLRRERITK